ncbi:MAG: NADH-quinone oxidoreductase subunit C [Bacteroidetes bacterium]|nr:NADH-quinone oxidoreductase subunit C [Bacteroidota bacterium]MBU1720633.1 NADH-quinone oxidoreductase subunit C [Bacteroidota bacterium]
MATIETLYNVRNNQSVDLQEVPVFDYADFSHLMIRLFEKADNHCVNYFAYKTLEVLHFVACVADDETGDIALLSHKMKISERVALKSLTVAIPALHVFEREIHENFGVGFSDHPWLKPIRYPKNRADSKAEINDYPFYSIKSEELHEVGVGPIHAGVIEPGHFRFICNGENVLHLEIQLGWQHRGIEKLMLEKESYLQKNILAENIAGDTATAHATAYTQLMEALAGIEISERLEIERALAMELERIAIHVGDISALCVDVAYHLGAAVFSVLRTGIINFTQAWCGNRLGKGLIRAGGTNFPFTEDLKQQLYDLLDDFEKRFNEMGAIAYHLPSVENRFDDIGTITEKQARLIGSVGMAARMTNVPRDIRQSHPFAGYKKFQVNTITLKGGDVFARFLLRRKEIKASIGWIRNVLANTDFCSSGCARPDNNLKLKPNSFATVLTEGWRGEICHCAVTDENGILIHYKIKDPSLHNWKSLELSLRNLEISDFPINNKSYNLSYCGHDL